MSEYNRRFVDLMHAGAEILGKELIDERLLEILNQTNEN